MTDVAMAAGLSSRSLLPAGATDVMRKHVYVDTNVVHPALIRAAVDLLGADNVIAGSDWPLNDGPVRDMLTKAMQDAGLSDDEQHAVAAGNCRRLPGIG